MRRGGLEPRAITSWRACPQARIQREIRPRFDGPVRAALDAVADEWDRLVVPSRWRRRRRGPRLWMLTPAAYRPVSSRVSSPALRDTSSHLSWLRPHVRHNVAALAFLDALETAIAAELEERSRMGRGLAAVLRGSCLGAPEHHVGPPVPVRPTLADPAPHGDRTPRRDRVAAPV